MANSVIIFDEAQMLPVKYLKPCIQAVSELVYNYHSTAVLCTATQPSLRPYFPTQLSISEICPRVEIQYVFFRRTIIKNSGELSEEELTDILKEHTQALCILNSRREVQRIYQSLQEEEGVFHLSTFMYPEHRKRQLRIIRERLENGQPCRLIATSLVEAGVDFDFPAVFRELAGVDSVIQAAGRCNREGRRKKEDCITTVFTMKKNEAVHFPPSLRRPLDVAAQIAEQYEDIASLEAIEAYFKNCTIMKEKAWMQKILSGRWKKKQDPCCFPLHLYQASLN